MMTSVALCTYNGELYLVDQLQSLADQIQLPDELIVCDDGSTDQTLSILRNFATTAPFPVHIYRNQNTLGVTRNFELAITLCQGEIIFLCDQDDIWSSTKIHQACNFLKLHSHVKAVFSNATLIDRKGHTLGKTIWDINLFDQPTRLAWCNGLAFDISLLSNRIPGCTLAFRRSLIATALPFPQINACYMHDWWLVLAATSSNSLFFVEDPLIGYREHADQVVGIKSGNLKLPQVVTTAGNKKRQIRKITELQEQIKFLTAVITYLTPIDDVDPLALQKVNAYRDHIQLRQLVRTMKIDRLWPIFNNLWKGHYHQYARPGADWSDPWRTVISDLISY